MYFVQVYIFLKKFKKKKNSRFPNLSPKKRKNFQIKKKKKSLWTRGIEPLSHLKKKFFELGALDFLVAFSKKTHFFLIKISRF